MNMWCKGLIFMILTQSSFATQPHQRDPFKTPLHHSHKQHSTRKKPFIPEIKCELLGITRSHKKPERYGAMIQIEKKIECITEGENVGPFHIGTITSNSLTLLQGKKWNILTLNTD